MQDDEETEQNLDPPRTLRGRKARRIWRELAPKCDAIGTFNVGSAQLLAVLCTMLAELGDNPDNAFHAEIGQARAIGKSLGIFR